MFGAAPLHANFKLSIFLDEICAESYSFQHHDFFPGQLHVAVNKSVLVVQLV